MLPTLDENVKDGNSLVDTDFYDGQLFETEKKIKPFNWRKAFPEVFKIRKPDVNQELKYQVEKVKALQKETGELIERIKSKVEEPQEAYGGDAGFDVVIGNPPYVRQELLGEQKQYFESRYRVYHGMADLYSYFMKRGVGLLNKNGLLGIIVANKWMRANYGEPLRKWMKQQNIKTIIDFGNLPVFDQATTYPCIFICGKGRVEKHFDLAHVKTLKFASLEKYVTENRVLLEQNSLDDSGWNLASDTEQKLLKKINKAGAPLGDYVKGKIY
ncbi:MAG: Eco57I restriction-modification methylase domain-containing protein [Chitinophagales bacterium]|nr:Eco57I restriction-modification methylase domain-containing protein [Chitinophagales bacterium]